MGLAAADSAVALPSGWAYELISQVDPLGNDIQFGAGAADGEHAWVNAIIPVSPEQSTGNAVTYAARRTESGWVLRDLGTSGSDWHVIVAGAADGSRAITTVCDGLLLNCLPGSTALERVDEDGERTTLLETPYVHGTISPKVVGTSADLSRVLIRNYSDSAPLLAEDTHVAGAGLYESNDGALEYIGLDENGQVLPCGAVLADDFDANIGNGNGFEQSGVSADGGTVVFESPDPTAGCPDPVDVYIIHDGTVVDISRPTDGAVDQGATFAGASRDGNLTYFATTNQLVAEDTDAMLDVYSYDRRSGIYERISGGVGVALGSVPQVAVSPSGDYVYFNSSVAFNGEGVDGRPNLYVYHAGTIRFIATATIGDFFIGGAIISDHATYITPDGTSVLFVARDELSGQPTGGLRQLFQYNAELDVMSCISCPPDGAVPTKETLLTALNPSANVDQRHQSDDGNTVAFETSAALLPSDTNAGVPDVYLWRRNEPLTLISSGHSEAISKFAGMSADGHSVFFESNDRLVPGVDQDNKKLYVARLGGGFPAGTVTPKCGDDACQGLLTPPSPVTPTASETLGAPHKTVHASRRLSRIVVVGPRGKRRRQAVQTGAVLVAVRADGEGLVRVDIAARIGGGWTRVDQVTRSFSTPGTTRVTLHLSKQARAYLATSGVMRIRITARHGHTVATSGVVLRTGSRGQGRGRPMDR